MKLARDTGSASLNLTKPLDPIDRKLQESTHEVKEKLEGENLLKHVDVVLRGGKGNDYINKDTLKQFAMFKAINENGLEGTYEEITSGLLFGTELNKYLTGGIEIAEMHKFKSVLDKTRKAE